MGSYKLGYKYKVTILITLIRGLKTLLITNHEPPSKNNKNTNTNAHANALILMLLLILYTSKNNTSKVMGLILECRIRSWGMFDQDFWNNWIRFKIRGTLGDIDPLNKVPFKRA